MKTRFSAVTVTGWTQLEGGLPGGHLVSHACSAGIAGELGLGGSGDGEITLTWGMAPWQLGCVSVRGA